ncbi:MAG TPA: trypsin-like peptidase domain-containing protein [Candidatus Limnocylindrales bacterium]|nr:trypsin-like peptidase domain-containing protein [Candidatus Limnocylindrales bacterium]
MSGNLRTSNAVRLMVVGALIALGAYWAGARWGPRGPARVEALLQAQKTSSRGSTGLTEEEMRTVNIYRQATSAVANINTRIVEYDFFQNPVAAEGAGSGFVIDARGYVLTNYHVVENAANIEVTLGDRSQYAAKFIGADKSNDVALLKIDPKGKTLSVLTLGDSSNLLVGQSVLAIGNPFRFTSTLTTGVISALGRTVPTGETTFIDEAIQTDAAINQGNSGGPLLNSRGEVIGINSAIYTPSGTTAGIGFAIPINTAKSIAQDLMTDGHVHRADLGVQSVELWPNLAEALSLPVTQGLLIERVGRDSPAAKAGLQGGNRTVLVGMFQKLSVGGDVIVALDGKEVANQLDVSIQLNHKKPGEVVHVTYYRGGKKLETNVTLGERQD